MTGVSEALVKQMIALVRCMANEGHHVTPMTHGSLAADHYVAARAIAAELPAPVDRDLDAAIAIARKHGWGTVSADSNIAKVLVEAIKRGKELAEQSK